LDYNPMERFSASEALRHEWITNGKECDVDRGEEIMGNRTSSVKNSRSVRNVSFGGNLTQRNIRKRSIF
jgi:serine/threonine protein kinase